MKWNVPFFIGIIKVGTAHLKLVFGFNIPMFINQLPSVFRVSSCILGIRKGLAWYGFAPSTSSPSYSEPVYLCNVPSNIA